MDLLGLQQYYDSRFDVWMQQSGDREKTPPYNRATGRRTARLCPKDVASQGHDSTHDGCSLNTHADCSLMSMRDDCSYISIHDDGSLMSTHDHCSLMGMHDDGSLMSTHDHCSLRSTHGDGCLSSSCLSDKQCRPRTSKDLSVEMNIAVAVMMLSSCLQPPSAATSNVEYVWVQA